MKWHAFFLVFVVLLSGCRNQPQYEVKSIFLDELAEPLSCRVVVPRQLPDNAPLMIAYHGVGDTAESMATYSKLDQLAARHRFLLVYPDANGKLWKIPRSDAPDNDVSRELDRFDVLLQEMEQQHGIDPDRVYVVGMSQGATFAQWLISERSSQLAAAAAHSGAPSSETDLSKGRTPILLIAGQEDPVHEAMVAATVDYQAAGIPSKFISVPNLAHQWSAQSNEAIWAFLNNTSR